MKVLLIPLAGIAFVVFLLVLGAIGLFVSMAVISLFGRIVTTISRGGRLVRRRTRRRSV